MHCFPGNRGTHSQNTHVTLRWGVNGGPQPDKWKHMVRTAETIECQSKDADRGANLHEAMRTDSRDYENRRNKDSYT